MSWLASHPERDRLAALGGLLCGALLLLICVAIARQAPREVLLSYLSAFIFFTGLAVGSVALMMIHLLTGGAWGQVLRSPLMAAGCTLPLQALLAVPLLIGVRVLYPWAMPGALAGDEVLRKQSWYLEPSLYIGRTVAYFVLWCALLILLRRWLHEPRRAAALTRLAASGLIAYALSSLLAATDWVMSLEPHWHSSTFGLMVATGWMMAAAALAVLERMSVPESREAPAPQVLTDLGNLLLMFLLAWSYLAFMQYLTVWSADLPAETVWYIPRTLTSWRFVAWLLIALNLAAPFPILLSRRAKRRRGWLAGVAALLLLGTLIHSWWMVLPTFRPHGFSLRWSDLCAVLGMGALWLTVYSYALRGAQRTPELSGPRPTTLGSELV